MSKSVFIISAGKTNGFESSVFFFARIYADTYFHRKYLRTFFQTDRCEVTIYNGLHFITDF